MANETFTANQTTDPTLGFDADGDGVIDPLEVVTSTVTITNNSTAPAVAATGVQFSETLDGMTIVDQDGDDINVSPIAFDDAYNVIGNITFAVTAADGILGGPTAIHSTLSADAEFFTNTIGANTATQTHIVTTGVIETAGGSVTLNADGSFTYTADAGFTGADSFTYTLTDAGLDGDFATPGDNLTNFATVSLNVGPSVSVWFIDDTAPGSANLGTQDDPFTSIAAFNTAGGPAAGDIIYLRAGTYEEDDGINLADGQTLIGQGQDLVVNGVTIEEGDPALTPTIKVNAGANDGIDLGQNNTISSLNVDTTSGSGIGIDDDGHSVGTLSMSDISVSTSTGAGILIDQGGTVTITGDGNTISSGTGTALNITNTTIGAADLTFQSISANGAVNGIVLDTTGSSGGLTVTGVGATAGSGGTVQNSTSRGASIVNASDITLTNMNFTNNGTAVVGVIGSVSADAFILSASAAPSDTQANIYLRSVSDIELDNVTANLSNHIGIWGYSVNGLTLTNVTAEQNGDEIFEDGVQLVNVTGNITVTGGSFKDNASRSFEIQNNTGSPTVNIDGATFGNTNFPTAGGTSPSPSGSTALSTVLFATNGTNSASITSTVTDSTFQNVFNIAFHVDMAGNTSQNVTFGTMGHGNNVLTASQGVVIIGANSGGLTAKIVDNVLNNDETVMDTFASTNITVRRAGGATPASGDWNVTIDSNEIGLLGNDRSGNEVAGAAGISVDDQGSPSGLYKILIQDNTVYRVSGAGIQVGSANAGAHTVHATIINNIVADPQADAVGSGGQTQAPGILVFNGAGSTATTFAKIEGNDVDGLWDTAGVQGLIRVRHGNFDADMRLDGYAGTTVAQVNAYLAAMNPATTDPDGGGPYTVATSTQPLNDPIGSGSPILPPPLLAAPGGVEAMAATGVDPVPPVEQPDGGTDALAHAIIVDDGVLSQAELDYFVDAAIARWTATGLSAEQVAALEAFDIGVADMEGLNLASFSPTQITLDADAAGRGWYLDGTPLDDAEFGTIFSATWMQTDPTEAPAGHYDLLTTIMHEMGHALGVGDSYASSDRDDLMYGWLYTGERRLPGDGDADGAVAGSITEEEFLGAPIDIGVLPAGQTVTIQWQATIDAQNNQLIVNPVNTGTVMATNTDGFPDTNTNTVTTTLDTLILGGTIWNDNGAGGGGGGNGILDGTEPGINGVALTLFADDGDGTFDAGDTLLAPTVTSSQGGAATGSYSFAGLAPGNYIVRVDQSNFNAGAVLENMVSAIGTVDPDNNVDNDDNGDPVAGNGLVSLPITLAYNTEPTLDDTNTTLDFGVRVAAPGPLVFKLIDADNGQVIDQDVSNGVAPLDPSVFAGQLTLVGFAASGQTVSGPVTIALTGNGVNFSKVENVGPYSLFGDSGGTTFGGSSIQPGVYTVGANANGIPQSVAFTLQAIAAAPGPLVFKLIDADNGQVIDQDVSNGVAPLDPSVFAGQLTLVGFAASGQTVSGPVTIALTGNGVNFSKVENVGPYSLFGDSGGTTFGGSSIQPGVYTVGANANGIPQSVPFTLQAIAAAPGPLVFKLIDADNGQVIDQDVSNGVAPLDPSVFAGQLTLVGFAASGQTVSGPVTIALTGNGVNFSKVENVGPYSLFGDSGGTTFGGSSIQPGVYTVGANANGIPQSVPFTLQAIAAAPGPLVKAINAGGGAVTVGGISYEADTTAAPNSLAPGSDNFTFNNAIAIAGTDNDVLHQTERWGDPFGYDIPLANGQYQLELDFAEIYWGAPGGAAGGSGSRVFDVTVEGQQVISDLDLFDDLGAANATSVLIPVTVSDGVLDIDFAADANNAKLSALVVYSDFV